MLFNSYIFLFGFLPITIFGFYFIDKLQGDKKLSISWLILCSLFFYGWWNPPYVILLISSVLINFSFGQILNTSKSKKVLILSISFNIILLGYFKYSNFFIENAAYFFDFSFNFVHIILPLAISFFTFQQIIYLLDSYKGLTQSYNFHEYALFVTFFPQLIAGPIVNHKEIMPQIHDSSFGNIKLKNFAVGISIFFIGLFKKVFIADSLSQYVIPIMNANELGVQLTFIESWLGMIAYSFQLYFDFSGYSDMAVGLARIFGIILPVNFLSPFRSTNIAEFWRRWHITLSNFIKNYLYFPLSIKFTRVSMVNQYSALPSFFITLFLPMLYAWGLAGLWHGAAWNFVIFGLMHGFYLIVYQVWSQTTKPKLTSKIFISASRVLGIIVTYLSVVFSWVFFRTESVSSAVTLLKTMLGVNGIILPMGFKGIMPNFLLESNFFQFGSALKNSLLTSHPENLIYMLGFASFIIFCMPNIFEYFKFHHEVKEDISHGSIVKIYWGYNFLSTAIISLLALLAIMYMQGESEFLYYQF
jgi:alginate O-acetyltransferase complex protein AlgI